MCLCVLVTHSRPSLCDPVDCSPPGSSVHGVLQARVQEWAAVAFSGGLSNPGIKLVPSESPGLAGGFFITSPTWESQSQISWAELHPQKTGGAQTSEHGLLGEGGSLQRDLLG